MKKISSFLFLLFILWATSNSAYSQLSMKDIKEPEFKVVTRSYGPILGFNRGKFTFIELGAEYHWRKVKLVNPKIYSVGANFEYNFKYNSAGYKINFWTKQNRVDLTYGLSLCYFTDFHYYR